jgi:Ca2+-binding RTX toxin-like protein
MAVSPAAVSSYTLNTTAKQTTLHGLGGNDTLTGGTTDDILVGGAGNDTLTSIKYCLAVASV